MLTTMNSAKGCKLPWAYPIPWRVIVNFKITEEASKDSKGQPCTVFYVREQPFTPGYSIQATALTLDSANWLMQRLAEDLG